MYVTYLLMIEVIKSNPHYTHAAFLIRILSLCSHGFLVLIIFMYMYMYIHTATFTFEVVPNAA